MKVTKTDNYIQLFLKILKIRYSRYFYSKLIFLYILRPVYSWVETRAGGIIFRLNYQDILYRPSRPSNYIDNIDNIDVFYINRVDRVVI